MFFCKLGVGETRFLLNTHKNKHIMRQLCPLTDFKSSERPFKLFFVKIGQKIGGLGHFWRLSKN